MAFYNVELPLVGSLLLQVEADNAEQAIDKAIEIPWRLEMGKEGRDNGVELGETFETPRQPNRGNVCHIPCQEAYAELER